MLGPRSALGALGPWAPASRFWQSGGPEWDAVALSADGKEAPRGFKAKGGVDPLLVTAEEVIGALR